MVESPQRTVTASSRQAAVTRKLSPIDEGKNALARRLPLVVRLLGQARRLGNPVEVVVLVGIAAPLRGMPVGMRKPATYQFEGRSRPGKLLGIQLVTGPGTDQVEPQRLDEALANRTGIGGGLGRRHRNRSSTLH